MYMVADCIYQNFADYSIIQPGQMLGYFFCVKILGGVQEEKKENECYSNIQQNKKNQSGRQEKEKKKCVH